MRQAGPPHLRRLGRRLALPGDLVRRPLPRAQGPAQRLVFRLGPIAANLQPALLLLRERRQHLGGHRHVAHRPRDPDHRAALPRGLDHHPRAKLSVLGMRMPPPHKKKKMSVLALALAVAVSLAVSVAVYCY